MLVEVLNNCSLSYYALADTSYSGVGKVSNKLRHFFWFPATDVKAGEFVVLRTGSGTNDSYKSNERTYHRFYWNLGSAVWNNTGDAAVVFQLKSWKTTKAK